MLGFDTSMAPTAACVLTGDGKAFTTEPPPLERLLGPPGHSAELLPELSRLLERAGQDWGDVTSIAVGTGPGTFTGLRIGVATARALGQALGVPLRPVSSLGALAAGLAGPAGADRSLLPLIDARRGQVFAALYTDPRSEPGWGPVALDPEALIGRLGGMHPTPMAAGDWAVESREFLEGAGVPVPPAESPVHAVSALHLCRLAARVEPVAPQQVEPTYVRLPDAEINRRNARKNA